MNMAKTITEQQIQILLQIAFGATSVQPFRINKNARYQTISKEGQGKSFFFFLGIKF